MSGKLFSNRTINVLLLIAIVAGFWLRFRCLGCLGFRGDEDLTSLAVKALVSSGVPELPSGMIYLRFYPYQWLLALSVNLFGFGEFSMRLPAVVIGTLTVLLAYVFASRLTDRRLAIIVAIGIAFSFWQIEISRAARMYAPFFFLYIAAALSIYDAYFTEKSRNWAVLPVLLSWLALSMHQLGYSLAIFFLLAIFLRPTVARSLSLVVQAALVGAGFLVVNQVHQHFFYRGRDLAGGIDPGSQVDSEGGGIISAILDQFAFPDFDLFFQAATAVPVVAVVYVLAVIGLSRWCLLAEEFGNLPSRISGLAAIAAAALHQFNVAVMLLGLQLVLRQERLAGLKHAGWYRFAVVCGALLAIWVTVVISISLFGVPDVAMADIGFRKLLRALIDYPNFRLFWSFPLERPLLAIPLLLGTLWCIDKVARPDPEPRSLFLLGAFWIVLFANGVFDTKFEFFRYNIHLDAFYLVLVAIGIVGLPDVLRKMGVSSIRRSATDDAALSWYVAAGIIVLLGVRPDMGYLTSSRDHFEAAAVYRATDLDRATDFRSPGYYVKERLSPGDRIYVFDPREYWNYIGKVDFWIFSENYESQTFRIDDRFYDLYIGAPVITDVDRLKDSIRGTESGDVWILYTASRLWSTRWVSSEIKDFIRSLDNRIVFTGQDQDTVVVSLTPDDPLRGTSTRKRP